MGTQNRNNGSGDIVGDVIYAIAILGATLILVHGCIKENSPERQQEKRVERILRSEGSVIDKEVDPSGYRYNFWLGRSEYMPDRYYLKVRLGDGSVIKKKVDAVKYMQTNIGDEVKNDGY